MSLQIAGGLAEDGIIIGNTYDKYRSKNPIVRWMMNGFDASLSELVGKVSPTSIHDIGCGEGYWTMRWHEQGIRVKGSDFSRQVIDISRKNVSKGLTYFCLGQPNRNVEQYITARHFIPQVFEKLNIPLKWEGEDLDEIAIINSKDHDLNGKIVVKIDKKYFRPSEVDVLIGDSSKARKKLLWTHKYVFNDIIDEMISEELKISK